jgi:hypothetical protein
MNQERDIKYIGRDFNSFKEQLINLTKNYFSDTYNDFSPTSPGMMFIEMVAYVGDVLSFYQDIQLQETFLQYAKDPKNLFNMAYTLGYRPKISSVSETIVEVKQVIDADSTDPLIPDWTQALTVLENTQLRGSTVNSPIFNIPVVIDFSFSSSLDPTLVTVEDYDTGTGNPISYGLTKTTKAFSGEIVTVTRTFTDPEKFTTITIEDTDIVGILDIVDSEENIWYEVPYLGQETIFTQERNISTDQDKVYNTLALIKTPRRFVSRFNPNGNLNIQFGAGIYESEDSEIIPSPANVGLGTNTGISRLDYTYDPSNFLYTKSYGLAPSNTTLTVRYLKGGGIQSNIPANTLTQIQSIQVDKPEYLENLTFTNINTATGGSDGDTVEDIRQSIFRSFNEQGRVVTLQDYEVRSYSMPPTLGSVSKVFATQSTRGSSLSGVNSISLYVLSYDQNRNFSTATDTLKDNLRTYLSAYKTLTDILEIKDAFIINIGVEYDIITYPNIVVRDVLLKCNNALSEYLSNNKAQINQPINLANLYLVLDKIKGVQTVKSIKIVNKVGGQYSNIAYDIQGSTKDNVVYPSLDPSIFEIKFPDEDIKGRVTR